MAHADCSQCGGTGIKRIVRRGLYEATEICVCRIPRIPPQSAVEPMPQPKATRKRKPPTTWRR